MSTYSCPDSSCTAVRMRLGDLAQHPRAALLGRRGRRSRSGAPKCTSTGARCQRCCPAAVRRGCRPARPGPPARRSAGPAAPRRCGTCTAGRRGSGCPRGRCRAPCPAPSSSTPMSIDGRRGPGVAALHRHLAHAAEERRHGPAAQARRGEVLGLGEVEDLPARGERGEELVGEGDVVAGDDDRPVGGTCSSPVTSGR